MQRFAIIFCAASSLLFANVNRGLGYPMRPHAGDDHYHHAHTHFHDGVEHTHWHSHGPGEDHSLPDPESDHHDEIGHGGQGDHPCVPVPAPTDIGRSTLGKHLGLGSLAGVAHVLEPPTLLPAKPPPKSFPHEDNLNRLRTVILLT